MIDTLFIKDLILPCAIGVFEHEQQTKQTIIINLALSVETPKAGQTDNINNAVNYYQLYQDIISLVETSHYQLVESLAEALATKCLEDKRITQVKIRIDKPKALPRAKSAAIEIIRKQK